MGAESTVHVRMPWIERAWRSSGGTDVWLLLKNTATTLDQFVDALDEVNALWEGRSPEIGSFPSSSPAGHVVCVLDITSRAALVDWVEAFRNALERRGASANLTAAPKAHPPLWMNASQPPALTTFAAWTVDLDAMTADAERHSNWHVPQQATAAISSFASQWAIRPKAEVILRQNIFCLNVAADDVSAPLGQAVQATGIAGVDVVQDTRQRCRRVSLSPGGAGVFQVVDEQLGWQKLLHQLRSTLVGLTEYTSQAFIRYAHRGALSIMDIDRVVQLPGIRESHVRYNKHLLDKYVPDAHGLQVLREAHLLRAADLSRWDVSEVGHGRFLVEAADLEPWYADAVPDPAVLAQARLDFGDMLLTEQVISEHPAPWL